MKFLPALNETLQQALVEGAPSRPQCKFNPVDHLAYLLYNLNPAHYRLRTALLDISFVQRALADEIRTTYPIFWLWTEASAAEVIGKCARGYLVRKTDQVIELRAFWRTLEEEEGKEEEDNEEIERDETQNTEEDR